nr:MAG TPA: hypothetical protein [Caudoviricetes sp.]DAY66581.1 MAG TPA: hypothetical protein [Caudoviricetes sp.]
MPYGYRLDRRKTLPGKHQRRTAPSGIISGNPRRPDKGPRKELVHIRNPTLGNAHAGTDRLPSVQHGYAEMGDHDRRSP